MITVWRKGKPVGKVDNDTTAFEVADRFYSRFGDLDVHRDPDGWVIEPTYKVARPKKASLTKSTGF